METQYIDRIPSASYRAEKFQLSEFCISIKAEDKKRKISIYLGEYNSILIQGLKFVLYI